MRLSACVATECFASNVDAAVIDVVVVVRAAYLEFKYDYVAADNGDDDDYDGDRQHMYCTIVAFN